MKRDAEHVRTIVEMEHVVRIAKTPLGAAILRREADILHAADGRGGSPRLLSVQLDTSTPSLKLQKVPGQSLQQTILGRKHSGETLPAKLALRWLQSCAVAIDQWHSEMQMVHGDISPGNIILQQDRASLIDFALATAFGHSIRITEHTWANRAYASPEQIAGQRVDAPSDVFSLGVISSELLTGKRFCRSAPETTHVALPERLSKCLLQAVAPEPEMRHSSSTAFVESLLLSACD